MAAITDVADAILAELNAAAFSLPFTATRSYLPRYKLEDMETLHVTVVPNKDTVLPGDRGKSRHDYELDVAVQKKLTTADNAEIDPLVTLTEEIADYFRGKRLALLPSAVWGTTAVRAIYAPEHLVELGQFTSLLTFTFRVMR